MPTRVTRIGDLKVGDRVTIIRDGQTIPMVVWRTSTDPSIGAWDAATVHVRIRPGGYGETLRQSSLTRLHVSKVA